MVQKYQNEIAPIFYYGISTKTNEKDLRIPNLQPPVLVCTGKEAIPGVFPFTGHVTNKKWPLNEGRRTQALLIINNE